MARTEFQVRSGGTDLVPITLIFPADDQGVPLAGRHPGVVFVHGGFAPPARYEWQAQALARSGMVVAFARNELDLAFFSVDFGEAARVALVDPPADSLLSGHVDPQRVAVMGHSLGSVVALKLALGGRYQAVLLEAGFPDSADLAAVPSLGIPSLSLAGANDCSAKIDKVKEGWATLPSPTALVVLEGTTHYQFTNSDQEDRDRKCVSDVELDTAHGRIESALNSFFTTVWNDEPLQASTFDSLSGASVELR